MNNKFLNEAKELEARWAKTGLLDGLGDRFSRQTTAVMLECQRLHNETGTWDCCDECKERERVELLAKEKDHAEVPGQVPGSVSGELEQAEVVVPVA